MTEIKHPIIDPINLEEKTTNLQVTINENSSEEEQKEELIFILYINNFDEAFSGGNYIEKLTDFYSNIIIKLVGEGFIITNHFANSLLIKLQEGIENKFLELIELIANVGDNLRIGLQVLSSKQLIETRLINEKIAEKLKKGKITLDKLQNIWIKLYPESQLHLFDRNELFGKDVFLTKYLSELMNESNFIISSEVFEQIIRVLELDEEKQSTSIIKLIEIVNTKLKESKINFRISIPFPYLFDNEEINPSYAFVIYYSTENNEAIVTRFFSEYRREKQMVENIYLCYAAYHGGSDSAKNLFNKNRRDKIIKSWFNETHTSFFPETSYYYFDSLFSVYGAFDINFGDLTPQDLFKASSIKRSFQLDTIAHIKDFLVNTFSLSNRTQLYKLLTSIIVKRSISLWNVEKNRLPIFISFNSFPHLMDEANFRKSLNLITDHQVYFRTEDIYDNSEFSDSFVNKYLNASKDIVIAREPKDLNNYGRNQDDYFKAKLDKYPENLIDESCVIKLDGSCECEKCKLKTSNSSLIFNASDWFVLIIFSLEPSYLAREQLKNKVFELLIQEETNINTASLGLLETVSYGILRGSWDGYVLCNISKETCYSGVIQNILLQKATKSTFINAVIGKCELFFLKPFLKDFWIENLLKASTNS